MVALEDHSAGHFLCFQEHYFNLLGREQSVFLIGWNVSHFYQHLTESEWFAPIHDIDQMSHYAIRKGGGKIASLSVKRAVQVRAQLDLFVFHRKVEICQYVVVPTSADDWFNKGGPCVIMSM